MIYAGTVSVSLYEDEDGTRRTQTEVLQDSGIVKLDQVTVLGMLSEASLQVAGIGRAVEWRT